MEERSNASPLNDPKPSEIENHGFRSSPTESEFEEKQKTWADRRNQVRSYSVKKFKYLWKHRVGVVIILCLLALCLFPVWIAYTYVLEDRKFQKFLFYFFFIL